MNTVNPIILMTDSYKTSHWLQYPPGTEYVYSYIESRGGEWDKTVFFGIQAFIRKYLDRQITMSDVDYAETILKAHGVPFHREGWEYIVNELEGWLPIRIETVDEGLVIPTKNVLARIVNTDPKCYWLTSYMETALLRAVWYPTTVATLSYHVKEIIWKYLKKTSDDPAGQIGFKLHDFGARGVSSSESAMLGGMGHLTSFMGTDTLEAIEGTIHYYDQPIESAAGFSIPASEHSTMTSWGRDGEEDAYDNMLKVYKDSPIFACVSDSYDIYNATKKLWGEKLRQKVMSRQGTLVIRPDSGDPVDVICRLLEICGEQFGFTTNDKGYKVLPPQVRLIQGDGCTPRMIEQICHAMMTLGWSIDNIAFGMGGGLLQMINRDTLKFAMKCSYIEKANGEGVYVYKDPITDPGKKSKRGILNLAYHDLSGEVFTIDETQTFADPHLETLLAIRYENGHIINETDFDEVRYNADHKFRNDLID